MIWTLEFYVPGNPIALKRHRTVKIGNFTRQYDPSEGDKADFLVKAMENKPAMPLNEPLYVSLTFLFSRPKSHYRTGKNSHLLKAEAPLWHTGTPDADNLVKFICDSLNGVFWKDDKVICELHVRKYYYLKPGIRIKVAKQSENPL